MIRPEPEEKLERLPRLASLGDIPDVREPKLKRVLDICLSSFMLIVALPVIILIVVAIKIEDRGSVFYAQRRWGYCGAQFNCYKFRTMRADSDVVFGVKQAEENDRRITRAGRVLRATGLDELPQVYNILRGQMSFVGPRALAVGEILHALDGRRIDYQDVPGFFSRLAVRPGLTGLAAILLPKDATPLEKLEYDLRYVRELSVGLDLRLIARSFLISVRGKWESRQPKP